MSEEKNTSPELTPSAAEPKAPKKLQPRVAEKPPVKVAAPVEAPVVEASVAEAPAAKKSTDKKLEVKKPAVKKPSRLDETKARNKKALAEALAKAQAVQIPPAVTPQAPVESPKAKPVKMKKIKLVRHGFSMPETEYAQIAVLKKRIADAGGKAKRSELVRAGIAALSALDNVGLTAAMARIESLKTGRPKK